MNHGRTGPGALAISAFALSCLGVLSFGLLAIPGVICGHLARGKSERDRAFAGAALITGYCVLGMFLGLPLLALAGLALLSIPITGKVFQGLPDSGTSARPFEIESEAPGVWSGFFEQYGSLLAATGLGLALLVLAVRAAPRLGRRVQAWQLRRVVAINRSR